jgi:hypothetical protein
VTDDPEKGAAPDGEHRRGPTSKHKVDNEDITMRTCRIEEREPDGDPLARLVARAAELSLDELELLADVAAALAQRACIHAELEPPSLDRRPQRCALFLWTEGGGP